MLSPLLRNVFSVFFVLSLLLAACQKKKDEPSTEISAPSSDLFPFAITFGAYSRNQPQSVKDILSGISNLAAGRNTTGCKFNIPNFLTTVSAPSCNSPTVYFSNHPDLIPNTLNVDGNYWPSPGYPDDDAFGAGQLGIWSANEGSQACISAVVDQMILNQVTQLQVAQTLVASLHCSIRAGLGSDVALPDAGSTVALKQKMVDAIAHDARVTVANADLTRESDVNGLPVYRYDIQIAYFSTVFTVSWRHRAAADASTMAGEIVATITAPYAGNGSQRWVYQKDGEIQRTFAADAITDPPSGMKYRTEWNPSTGLGAVRINSTPAKNWGDPTADAMAMGTNWNVDYNADGSGCGFFGKGPKNSTAITGMQCNTGRGGFIYSVEANLAQKQCFDSTGLATVSKLRFAPIAGCSKPANKIGIYGASSLGEYDYFRYSATLPSPTQMGPWDVKENWDVNETHTITHDLIDITTDSDFANLRTFTEATF